MIDDSTIFTGFSAVYNRCGEMYIDPKTLEILRFIQKNEYIEQYYSVRNEIEKRSGTPFFITLDFENNSSRITNWKAIYSTEKIKGNETSLPCLIIGINTFNVTDTIVAVDLGG